MEKLTEIVVCVENGGIVSIYASEHVKVRVYDYDHAALGSEGNEEGPSFDWSDEVAVMPENTDWDAFARDPKGYKLDAEI